MRDLIIVLGILAITLGVSAIITEAFPTKQLTYNYIMVGDDCALKAMERQ